MHGALRAFRPFGSAFTTLCRLGFPSCIQGVGSIVRPERTATHGLHGSLLCLLRAALLGAYFSPAMLAACRQVHVIASPRPTLGETPRGGRQAEWGGL